jgi:hypothetical protein
MGWGLEPLRLTWAFDIKMTCIKVSPVKKIIVKTFALIVFLNVFPNSLSPVNANSPTIYESLSGTNNASINSSGSSDSVGFTGNWSMVNSYKNPYTVGAAGVYSNTYNSNFKFPTNTRFTVPSNNTAASTNSNTWNVFYSARQISSAINFDSTGSFYLSFLLYSPAPGGNWGSNVVGLIDGLPTSASDTSKNAIFLGRSYSGKPTIHLSTANQAVWNSGSYSALGNANNAAAPDGNSWFVISKISTAATGNDSIQLKFYASTDTVPSTDAGISWDVTYSGTITGSYNYLSVQTEYNANVDEIRGGPTYAAVSGAAVPVTLGTPTVSGSVSKGIYTTISVTVDSSGSARFFLNGKRIPGCTNRPTTGLSPNFTVTCNWKPPIRGLQRISATFTPTNSAYLSGTTPSASLQVLTRTNKR